MKAEAHIIVKGLVQGVGYRYFVNRKANDFGLTGWVKNLFNGDVEVVAEGEKGLVEDLINELKIGPTMSSVSDVIVKWNDYKNSYSSFNVRF